jgi:ribosomal protein S18 acetylase RimI-like enzyme
MKLQARPYCDGIDLARMRQAVLGFDPNNAAALALYTSMGFAAVCYFVMYRKKLW